MLQSHLIEADGVFLGAAIRLDRGYRFVAVDLRVEPMDETMWPSLADVQRIARHLFLTGRFPERPRPSGPLPGGEGLRLVAPPPTEGRAGYQTAR